MIKGSTIKKFLIRLIASYIIKRCFRNGDRGQKTNESGKRVRKFKKKKNHEEGKKCKEKEGKGSNNSIEKMDMNGRERCRTQSVRL